MVHEFMYLFRSENVCKKSKIETNEFIPRVGGWEWNYGGKMDSNCWENAFLCLLLLEIVSRNSQRNNENISNVRRIQIKNKYQIQLIVKINSITHADVCTDRKKCKEHRPQIFFFFVTGIEHRRENTRRDLNIKPAVVLKFSAKEDGERGNNLYWKYSVKMRKR